MVGAKDINRFKRRGNSTVLRRNTAFSSNLGSKQTSLTQPSQPCDRRSFFGH